jgi:hypothetical protein
MAKQDVLDAINATIAPNNIKGITAESLNNVLTMMTENAGEGGSGDGALRIIVPEIMTLGPEFISIGEFSPTSWEEIKSNYEQSTGLDFSEYDAAVKASFEHNANVVQQIIEKGKAGQGVSVVLDQTPYFPATMNLMLQAEPEIADMLEESSAFAVQPAGFFMQYLNVTPEGEATMGDIFECVLAPTGNICIDGMDATYPSNMLISLNLDGSLLFEVIEEEQPSSGSGVVTFYAALEEELPEEYKTKNAEAFRAFKFGDMVTCVVIFGGQPVGTAIPSTIEKGDTEIFAHIVLADENGGVSRQIYIVDAEGCSILQATNA